MGCYENQSPFALAPPDIIAPVSVSGGSTGSCLVDSFGTVVVAGTKTTGTLVHAFAGDSWRSDTIAQQPASHIWSNQMAFSEECVCTQRYRVATADGNDASAHATTLMLHVIPEPACALVLALMMALSRRRTM